MHLSQWHIFRPNWERIVIDKLRSKTQGKEKLICRCVNQRDYSGKGTNIVLHFQCMEATSRPCEEAKRDRKSPPQVWSNETVLNEARGRAACAAHAGRSVRPECQLHPADRTASDGLTLRGGSGAGPAVTADSHRVGVEGVDSRGTVRQLDGHLLGLVVGTDSMIGFNVGGFQNGFCSASSQWTANS